MSNLNFKALLDTAQFTQKLKGIDNDVQSVAQKMGKVAKIAGAAIASIGVATAVAIKGQINYADALGETAQKLGVSTDKLSAYQYAAKLSGVSNEALEGALTRLNRTVEDNADRFRELGIEVKKADGSYRDSADVLTDIAGVLSEMPDGAEKSALAMELLGKSGAELVPLLNQGKDGIAALMAEAQAMGLVITPDQAEAAGKFNDAMDKIASTMQGALLIAFAELTPVIETVATFLLDLVNKFNELDEKTKSFIVIGAMVAAGFTAIAVAVGALGVAFNLIMAPITLVAGAIVLLGAAIAATIIYWDEITAAVNNFLMYIGETLLTAVATARDAMVQAWEVIKTKTTELKDWFIQVWQDIIDYLKELPALMLELGGQIIQGLWDGLKAKWEGMKQWFNDSINGLTEDAKWLLGIQSPSKVFEEIGGNIVAGLNVGLDNAPLGENFQSALQSFIDSSRTTAEDLAGVFTKSFKGMEDGLVNFVKTGKLDFSSMIDSMLDDLIRFSIQSAMYGGPGGGGGLLGGLGGGSAKGGGAAKGVMSRNGNVFGSSGLQNFAKGGVFNQKFSMPMGDGRTAIGAEAGPEAIMPLQRGADGKLGVALAGAMTSRGDTIVNNFNATINPGPNTSAKDARKFADEFNRAVETKVLETMAKRQNTGLGGRR